MCFSPFSSPSIPAQQPITVPSADSDAVLRAGQEARSKAARKKGFASTILSRGAGNNNAGTGAIGTNLLLGS